MNAKEIGNRLTKLRGNRSQQEVVKAVDISPSALSMYENGERIPRDEVKERLAAYYDTTVQALFFDN